MTNGLAKALLGKIRQHIENHLVGWIFGIIMFIASTIGVALREPIIDWARNFPRPEVRIQGIENVPSENVVIVATHTRSGSSSSSEQTQLHTDRSTKLPVGKLEGLEVTCNIQGGREEVEVELREVKTEDNKMVEAALGFPFDLGRGRKLSIAVIVLGQIVLEVLPTEESGEVGAIVRKGADNIKTIEKGELSCWLSPGSYELIPFHSNSENRLQQQFIQVEAGAACRVPARVPSKRCWKLVQPDEETRGEQTAGISGVEVELTELSLTSITNNDGTVCFIFTPGPCPFYEYRAEKNDISLTGTLMVPGRDEIKEVLISCRGEFSAWVSEDWR